VQKSIGRGERAALLDVEEPGDSYRLETIDIPDPTLQEAADAEETGSFLRTKERIPVRRRSRSRFAWKNRWVRLGAACAVVVCLLGVAWAVWEVETVLLRNPHFVLASPANIQVTGNRVVIARDVQEFFTPDLGRSLFRVPLERRRAAIENIPWVRSATVMRLWPNRLRVNVVERTPIAFARDGNSVRLVDEDGVLLDLPEAAAQQYSFPVVSGVSASDPESMRTARMQQYQQFLHALDADGGHVSSTVSEVDLADPEDIRAVFTGGTRNPVVHLGDTDYLSRYRAYQAHLTEWLQQYPQLRSVDMRYGKQVVLDTGNDPEPGGTGNADVQLSSTATAPIHEKPIREEHASAGGHAVAKTIASNTKKTTGSLHASKTAAAKITRHKGRSHAASTVTKHRSKVHKRTPERGHTVRDPIAHVVSGA